MRGVEGCGAHKPEARPVTRATQTMVESTENKVDYLGDFWTTMKQTHRHMGAVQLDSEVIRLAPATGCSQFPCAVFLSVDI